MNPNEKQLNDEMPVPAGDRLDAETFHRGPILDSQRQRVKPLTDSMSDEDEEQRKKKKRRRLLEG